MASCGVSLRGGRRRTATAPPRSKASHATPRTCPLRRSPWQLGLNHAATAVRGTQRGLGQLVAARQNAGVHPVPTQQTQGRDMQCREGGERKLLKREGRGRSCSAVVGGGVPCSDQPPAGIADSAYLSAGLSASSSAGAECSAAAQPTAAGLRPIRQVRGRQAGARARAAPLSGPRLASGSRQQPAEES